MDWPMVFIIAGAWMHGAMAGALIVFVGLRT